MFYDFLITPFFSNVTVMVAVFRQLEPLDETVLGFRAGKDVEE